MSKQSLKQWQNEIETDTACEVLNRQSAGRVVGGGMSSRSMWGRLRAFRRMSFSRRTPVRIGDPVAPFAPKSIGDPVAPFAPKSIGDPVAPS